MDIFPPCIIFKRLLGVKGQGRGEFPISGWVLRSGGYRNHVFQAAPDQFSQGDFSANRNLMSRLI